VRSAADDERLAAERRIIALFYGGIKRVHVDVEDLTHGANDLSARRRQELSAFSRSPADRGLDQIEPIAIEILEDGDDAVGRFERRANEGHAAGHERR